IGGGSADAAATLLGLARFHGLDGKIDLAPIARKLGADVPMCLNSGVLRATGTGSNIQDLEIPVSFPAILVNPGIGLSTPDVFGALENKDNPPIEFGDHLLNAEALSEMRNDLEEPAITLVPQIADVLDLISRSTDCLLSRMSGSGTTCFGIFNSQKAARDASEFVRLTRPDWWCVETTLGSYDKNERIKLVQGEEVIHEQY
ncbi:MAG: 4-(cytidine 5'-diphospho)-2-C-methyl-D-erythritol kinase, partial [Rhizobiaceae bacterium]